MRQQDGPLAPGMAAGHAQRAQDGAQRELDGMRIGPALPRFGTGAGPVSFNMQIAVTLRAIS